MFQHVTPGMGVSFDPRGIIWINLVEVHQEMLHTKYQSCRPSTFREEKFWNMSSFFLCSNLWPPGQDQSWPLGHHMNELGRGQQGDATYKISKLWAIQFQRRRIIKFSFLVPMFNVWRSGRGQFKTRGILSTNLVEVHKEIPHTKYQSSRPSSVRKEEL